MSITAVNTKIKAAMKDSFITTAEAQKIVVEAQKGPVTIGEAKVVRELFERAPTPTPPGMMVTLAIPENPNDVIFEQGAKNVLETFFAKNDVPAGKNLRKFITQIEDKLANTDVGSALANAPDTKKLHMVRLPYPQHAADMPSKTAFLDPKKKEFFLLVSGGFMAPNASNTHWYGPISLKDAAPSTPTKLSPARTAQLKKLAEGLQNIQWKSGGFIESQPVGSQRYESFKANDRRPVDGNALTVFVRAGQLNAPKDPNKTTEYFLQSDAARGGKSWAGPFSVGALPFGDGSGWGHGIDRPRIDDAAQVDGPHIHPPQGHGSIAGTLLKKNGEFFIASHGLTFEILAGGNAKKTLAGAQSGDELQLAGEFKMLTDPSGGPMRRVLETEDVSVLTSSVPVNGPHIHPPQGHGSIAGTLVTVGSEYFLTTRGLSFEILAGGPAKAALAGARSGDKLQITGEFKMLSDPSGGPMRRVLETEDVAVI